MKENHSEKFSPDLKNSLHNYKTLDIENRTKILELEFELKTLHYKLREEHTKESYEQKERIFIFSAEERTPFEGKESGGA